MFARIIHLADIIDIIRNSIDSDDNSWDLWGTVTIGSKGQIVIPKAARETFELNEGDRLVVLGDDAEGIALVKADVFEQRVQEALKLSRQMTNE